jgi:hypothetical protein
MVILGRPTTFEILNVHVLLLGTSNVPHLIFPPNVKIRCTDNHVVEANGWCLGMEALLPLVQCDILSVHVQEYHRSFLKLSPRSIHGLPLKAAMATEEAGSDGWVVGDLLSKEVVLARHHKLEGLP